MAGESHVGLARPHVACRVVRLGVRKRAERARAVAFAADGVQETVQHRGAESAPRGRHPGTAARPLAGRRIEDLHQVEQRAGVPTADDEDPPADRAGRQVIARGRHRGELGPGVRARIEDREVAYRRGAQAADHVEAAVDHGRGARAPGSRKRGTRRPHAGGGIEGIRRVRCAARRRGAKPAGGVDDAVHRRRHDVMECLRQRGDRRPAIRPRVVCLDRVAGDAFGKSADGVERLADRGETDLLPRHAHVGTAFPAAGRRIHRRGRGEAARQDPGDESPLSRRHSRSRRWPIR